MKDHFSLNTRHQYHSIVSYPFFDPLPTLSFVINQPNGFENFSSTIAQFRPECTTNAGTILTDSKLWIITILVILDICHPIFPLTLVIRITTNKISHYIQRGTLIFPEQTGDIQSKIPYGRLRDCRRLTHRHVIFGGI